MITKFIEAHSDAGNHGKFAIGWWDAEEWERPSVVSPTRPRSLLRCCGWPEPAAGMLWVMDLQTGEAAYLRHGGHAHNDLAKHKIWVCPLFEPFLEWLYDREPIDIDNLPDVVELTGVPLQLAGYRRGGPAVEEEGTS